MSGLFDTFNVAKRGLTVQQSAINTSSHNIANANTAGYSRQRSVAETTRPFGGMSKFDTTGAGQVGTGAQITSIQRIRNSFIDYQVRSETGTYGYYANRSNTLSQIEDVFGEPSSTGIQELTSKFYSAFQEVSKTPDKADVKTVAIKQASALADAINYAYNQLKKTSDDAQDTLQTNVKDVNSCLNQINELNQQIRGVSAVGQTPNDLMDKRDYLLDQLSNEFGIKIDKDNLDTINLSSTEYPNASLVNSDPSNDDYSRLSYVKGATAIKDSHGNLTGEVKVEYYPLGDKNAVTKSFIVKAANSSDTAVAKKTQDVIDNVTQNRILIGDKNGNVISETPSTTSGTDKVAVAAANVGGSTLIVDTKVDTSGKLTVTFNGNSADTITVDGPTVTNSGNTYATTKNGDGTTDIQLSSGVTIKIKADGSITSNAENIQQSTDQLEKNMFITYKYDTDSTGTAVNNVDNNHIKGEIAANQSVQNNIKEYMKNLDQLAAGLAYSVNAIQVGSVDENSTNSNVANQELIFVTYDESIKSNTTTDTGMTAKNIRVNNALISDSTKLNCNTKSTTGEGDGKRAAAIANLSSVKMDLSETATINDRKNFLQKMGITGFSDTDCLALSAGKDGSTVDTYYKTMINNLATSEQEATRVSDNQETILANLENQKAEESGVSIDEEMTNLIQYQHAYQANAKVISTIDELLDVVINGLMK